ncbi:MAG: Exopolyphosphatase [Formosa sp. Hel3_A1_48]|nr:MAG: Exopolyphosphatase [Formosa sp. Hel3_A1_48]
MPINLKKYAAIDIGSNAVRLFIADIIEHDGPTQFKKSELVRVPIRLGADSFLNQEISKTNIKRLIDAMKAFRLLMNVNGVTVYKACATSAMREASNAAIVVQKVLDQAKIQIDIIDGQTEAKIIAATDLNEILDAKKVYLYVDVGGGSTEFSIFEGSKKILSKSFKIGTVRLINDKVSKGTWDALKIWIKTHTKPYKALTLLGSGGNINKLFKMSNKKPLSVLNLSYLEHKLEEFSELSYEERILELGLKPDRADVILPATHLFLKAMKWSNAKALLVPKIGLSDGIVKSIYAKTIEGQTLK